MYQVIFKENDVRQTYVGQIVKNKKRGANYVSKIMLTPDCFKELCMISQTDKAKRD